MNTMEVILFFVCMAEGVGLVAQSMEYAGHRRWYCRRDLREMTADRIDCRDIAAALEIQTEGGEDAGQYVAWAINEYLDRKEAEFKLRRTAHVYR